MNDYGDRNSVISISTCSPLEFGFRFQILDSLNFKSGGVFFESNFPFAKTALLIDL